MTREQRRDVPIAALTAKSYTCPEPAPDSTVGTTTAEGQKPHLITSQILYILFGSYNRPMDDTTAKHACSHCYHDFSPSTQKFSMLLQ